MSDETQDDTKPRKRKVGRPQVLKDEYIARAQEMCELGATDIDLAEEFDVDIRTIYRWKNTNRAFSHALKLGKAEADQAVVRSLFHRAMGYRFLEEQAIKVKTGQFEEAVEVVDVERQVPPDTTAAIFWLKNRVPGEWRDKVEHEHTGKTGLSIEFVEPEKRDE